MNTQDIRDIAIAHKIKPGKLSKTNLIKTIQRTEGNFDCFATATHSVCDQTNCMWRKDCFIMAKRNHPLD